MKHLQNFKKFSIREDHNQPIEKDVVDIDLEDIESDLMSILNDFTNNIKQPKKNEGVMTTAGVALALPAVLGLVSKAGALLSKTYNKILGRVPNNETEFLKYMKEIQKIADGLHHIYLVPVEKVVGLFVKDKPKAHKISVVILHVIVAVFMVSAGLTSLKAFQSKNFSLSTLEAALSAVKGGELKSFISNIFNDVH